MRRMEKMLGALFDWWPLTLAGPVYLVWFKTFLSGPNWTARIRDWLENESWSAAYAGTLGWLNLRLDSIFGSGLFSGKSLNISFMFSVIYAFTWINIAFFNKDTNSIEIVISTPILIVFIFTIFLYYTNNKTIYFSPFVKLILIFIMLLSYNIYIYNSNSALLYMFASIFLVIAIFLKIRYTYISIILLYMLISLSLTAIIHSNFSINIIYFSSFFFMLPVINAVFDYFSINASRWLLKKLEFDVKRESIFERLVNIVWHSVLDIALGLFFLFCMAVVFAIMMHQNGAFETARNAPFSILGSTTSIMLLSTLIPTALHLFCVVFAILPALPFGQDRIVSFMPFRRNFDEFEAGDKAVVSLWLTFWSVLSVCIVYALMVHAGPWLLDRISAPVVWGLFGDGMERTFWEALFDAARAIQQWSGIDILPG